MALGAAVARWRRYWTRLEPGQRQLRALREEGDLDTLRGYLEERRATPSLRRRATLMIASMAPGGGDAGFFSGATDPAIIPILASLAEGDADEGVRRAATFGLSRTRDPAAADALMSALASSDEAIRVHGILGLERLKWRPAVDSIAELLGDPGCRRRAAEALEQIGDGRAIGSLWAASFDAESPREKERLEGAAVRLEETVGIPAEG